MVSVMRQWPIGSILMWLKFWIKFDSGIESHAYTWVAVEKYTDDAKSEKINFLRDIMKAEMLLIDWCSNFNHGKNGFESAWEYVEHPPLDWLERYLENRTKELTAIVAECNRLKVEITTLR
jgi:hypothetical protein